MRRMLLSGIVAATVGLPALANATMQNGTNTRTIMSPVTQPYMQYRQTTQPQLSQPGEGTLGGGDFGGTENGHVTSPGVTKIDTSSRGPINDVNPGQGTEDTLQSKNPKPVR